MRRKRSGAGLLALALLAACGGPPNAPPGAGAPGPVVTGGVQGDPIGFLLESRDSLRLPDSIVTQLVRLNLRLYQRNAAIQMSLDTIMRNARFDPLRARDSTSIPADLREKIDPLIALRRDQTAAARDSAYALLTPEQRETARVLFEKMAQRRRGTPPAGAPPGRP